MTKLHIQLTHLETGKVIDIDDYRFDDDYLIFNFNERVFEKEFYLADSDKYVNDVELIVRQEGSFGVDLLSDGTIDVNNNVIHHHLVNVECVSKHSSKLKQEIENEITNEYDYWLFGQFKPSVIVK